MPGEGPADAARAAHLRASAEREVACDFAGAASAAIAGGDARRAAWLAAIAGDAALFDRAAAALAGDDATRAAADLAARGFPAHAGALYERGDALDRAASAFLDAGDARRAAAAFERAGKPRDAAQALEAGLRARPDDHACRLALGELLARHGRTEAAVRALQAIDPGAPERGAALVVLARAFADLGLAEAAAGAQAELAALPEASRPAAAAPPAPAARGVGALLFGRYEAVREVATSVHARVHEAVDRVTGVRVAVKLFLGATLGAGRDALVRFEREASALARLRSPHVVPLHEYLPGGPAMVLAWMPGGSLADRLADPGAAITPARAVEIVGVVLAALGDAHRLGILHRDVKPANVLFDEVGAARLSDFGAAHLGDLSSTATAGAIGTLAYMSPEQRLGRPATIASDVYGAGAILAELLTGDPPDARDGGGLVALPSARHPDLGPPHDAIVARLVAPAPEDRPADAFEARRLLASVAWPDRPAPAGAWPRRAPASARPASPASRRLGAASDGDGRDADRRRHDAWTRRDVIVLPLDAPGELARARAVARANHPALPLVVRADPAAGELWVAAPLGRAIADGAADDDATAAAVARLAVGVAALHAAGGAHGAIDAEHVYALDGELTLAWPRRAPGEVAADAARDRDAIAALGGPAPRA